MEYCSKMGDHPPRLNTFVIDRIVNQYREGKAKKNPEEEIEPETACINSREPHQVTAYLCIQWISELISAGELNRIRRHSESEPE